MAQWSLHALLDGVDCRAELPDLAVSGVRCDSRQVEPGDLFVCVPGGKADGHAFARQALAAGAVAVVIQKCIMVCRKNKAGAEPPASAIARAPARPNTSLPKG